MSEKKQIKVQLDYLNPYLKRWDREGNRLPEAIAMSVYRVSGDEDALALWEKTQDVLIKEKDDEGNETDNYLFFTSEYHAKKSFEMHANAKETGFYIPTSAQTFELMQKRQKANRGISKLAKLQAEVACTEDELGTSIDPKVLNAFALMQNVISQEPAQPSTQEQSQDNGVEETLVEPPIVQGEDIDEEETIEPKAKKAKKAIDGE